MVSFTYWVALRRFPSLHQALLALYDVVVLAVMLPSPFSQPPSLSPPPLCQQAPAGASAHSPPSHQAPRHDRRVRSALEPSCQHRRTSPALCHLLRCAGHDEPAVSVNWRTGELHRGRGGQQVYISIRVCDHHAAGCWFIHRGPDQIGAIQFARIASIDALSASAELHVPLLVM